MIKKHMHKTITPVVILEKNQELLAKEIEKQNTSIKIKKTSTKILLITQKINYIK